MSDPAVIAARIGTAGRLAWPELGHVTDVALAVRVAARLAADPGAAFDPARDADVFLAFALADGASGAARVFETALVPQIDHALRRLRLPGGTADEVKQALRVELLVETPRGGGKIGDYAGTGELAAWVRVSATRKALKLAKRAGREESIDDLLMSHWPDGGAEPKSDPENRHMQATYAAELKRAIGEAFAALAVRQRNLLRQHILDELTIDDLARLYRVHRATCARWVAEARGELGRGTRKRLIAALGVPSEGVDSVLRFLDSDIELSISRILVTRTP